MRFSRIANKHLALSRRARSFETLEDRRVLAAPQIELLPVENIGLRSATLGIDLLDTGGSNPNVSVYWGTQDAGTSDRDWPNKFSFGSVPAGQQKTDVAELEVNAQYFYRALAFSFSGGAVWTDAATFTTLPPAPASLESDPILIVGATSARISGRVTDTGGDIPSVEIFYGTVDGGDDANQWSTKIDLGVFEGEFASTLGQLVPGADYFVRFAATNGIGRTWDATTYQISTAATPLLSISEWMAANSSTAVTRIRLDPEARFRNADQDFDWVEIQNAGNEPTDISGFHLTDSKKDSTKWQFPAGTIVPAHGNIVVYASGFDITDTRFDETERLHTNFKLSADGEYIGLTDPQGNVLHEVANYPKQFHDASYGFFGDQVGYFRVPTPGELNLPLAPGVEEVSHVWQNDDPAQQWTVTAKPTTKLGDLSSVSLNYRVMYEDEISVEMTDDGGGADAAAGDGIFTGIVPAGIAGPGQMIRYNVTVVDTLDLVGRAPLFANPTGSPEYYGTMIPDPAIDSNLPVLHRFIEEARLAESSRGTQTSIFYDGEFYDNAFIRIRGGTARSWPKKAYKIEFNDDQHFQFSPNAPRVDEINLNTTYTDKSYLRAQLTAEFQNDAGTPSPETFLVRMHQNSEFYSIAIMVEQPDNEFLARHGHDTDGSFYKGAPGASMRTTAGFEKKTREFEHNEDLQEFIDGLKITEPDELERFLFDNVNLPAQINFMATNVISQNIDASDKNYFIYRDTNGTGEWHMTPWDLDLTFGPDALNTDLIIADQNTRGASNPNTTHPFLGGYEYPLHAGKTNELLDRLIQNPRTQEMLLRRVRTLADQFLGTTYFQDRIDTLIAQIKDEVVEDREKWGNSAHFNRNLIPVEEEAQRIKDGYLALRYPYLTDFHVNGGVGIPQEQSSEIAVKFGMVESVPLSGKPSEQFFVLQNQNETSIDLSNWKITGAIETTLAPGTVIPAGESLYLAANVAGFRSRTTGPSGDQGLLVQGFNQILPENGQLLISDESGRQVSAVGFSAISGLVGDFNSDHQVDVADIQQLCSAIHSDPPQLLFDLNGDGAVDLNDHQIMISSVLQTARGDANLDKKFDSGDLVAVFQVGKYEDGIPGNATWAEGDWNCDGDFSTADLVDAFSDGQFLAQSVKSFNVKIAAATADDETNVKARPSDSSSVIQVDVAEEVFQRELLDFAS